MTAIRNGLAWVAIAAGVGIGAACSGGAGMAHTAVGTTNTEEEEPIEPAPTTSSSSNGATALHVASASASGSGSAQVVASTSASASATAETAVAPPALRVLTGKVTATPQSAAAYAVVYLEDGPPDPERGMSATLGQRNMFFVPGTLVVAKGGTIKFSNSDPFPHNIFSPDGSKFNLGVLPQFGSTKKVFNEVGPYTLLCNLHPGMIGYIFVAPTGYFAKADKNGVYTIKDVPEGTYKVSVWAKKYKAPTATVTIQGGDATLDFALSK